MHICRPASSVLDPPSFFQDDTSDDDKVRFSVCPLRFLRKKNFFLSDVKDSVSLQTFPSSLKELVVSCPPSAGLSPPSGNFWFPKDEIVLSCVLPWVRCPVRVVCWCLVPPWHIPLTFKDFFDLFWEFLNLVGHFTDASWGVPCVRDLFLPKYRNRIISSRDRWAYQIMIIMIILLFGRIQVGFTVSHIGNLSIVHPFTYSIKSSNQSFPPFREP